MRSGLLASNRNNPKRYLLLSMLLPMLLVAVGWIVLEVHPFGTRQILVTDFWHQYYPFLCILQEKLKHGESLLYTWQSGMGSNFAAMMAYYTASIYAARYSNGAGTAENRGSRRLFCSVFKGNIRQK